MATFTGTNEELHRHLGSRFTKIVQKLTQKHKATTACQHCGDLANLESAHVYGRSRHDIINFIAGEYTRNDVVSFNLLEFEEKFIAQHNPIEKTIIILCRSCHQRYDNPPKPPTKNSDQLTQATNKDGLLPIALEPIEADKFKEALLQSKQAEIEIRYNDGRTEIKPWNASRFRSTSNVMGNLRSRPEFRVGKWAANNIAAVHVKVLA